MTNRFKANSRFSNLVEEPNIGSSKNTNKKEKFDDKKFDDKKLDDKNINTKTVLIDTEKSNDNAFKYDNAFKNGNSFKNGNVRRNDRYNYRESKESRESREQFEKLILEQEKRKKEAEAQKNLSANNFPDLIEKKTMTNNTKKPAISYIEKTLIVKKDFEVPVEVVKPGWVEIKRDPNNRRRLVYTYGESTYKSDLELEAESQIEDKHKSEYNVLVSLVNLHNKRKSEYINMWGYDNWEKMFRFPNYDYDYFNRLDEEDEEDASEIFKLGVEDVY
jgi:hypothetical protein